MFLFDSPFRVPTAFHYSAGPEPAAFDIFRPRHSVPDYNSTSSIPYGTLGAQLDGSGGGATQPGLGYMSLLVFEAVMEVVCLSLPGYIIARQGMFDTEMQKFVANLNITLFTPCLSTYHPLKRVILQA